MKQAICGYHQDEEQHWVAELVCGHYQHVRHKPPFINRPWVVSVRGRKAMLGHQLECKKCDQGAPRDYDGKSTEQEP
jgi:hypothetical protein